MSQERKDTALQLLREIRDEQRATRQLVADMLAGRQAEQKALDKLAGSLFGLGKDLRRWFKSRTTQPALDFHGAHNGGPPKDTNLAWCDDCERVVDLEREVSVALHEQSEEHIYAAGQAGKANEAREARG